jgi:hypothetical protein
MAQHKPALAFWSAETRQCLARITEPRHFPSFRERAYSSLQRPRGACTQICAFAVETDTIAEQECPIGFTSAGRNRAPNQYLRRGVQPVQHRTRATGFPGRQAEMCAFKPAIFSEAIHAWFSLDWRASLPPPPRHSTAQGRSSSFWIISCRRPAGTHVQF